MSEWERREITINRDADGPLAVLASETWFRVTDDHVPEPHLDEWPEFYYRAGMLSAFQLVVSASRDPESERGRAVLAAIEVAAEMLAEEAS